MGLKSEIKAMARENGAALVGIASRERLATAPPSADPSYLLPSTRSIISFAIPLDRQVIRDYLAKKDWLGHGADQKRIYRSLYSIADHLSAFLRGRGFEARGVDANSIYRPEPGGTTRVNAVVRVPDFSHRYGAVAAGLGWLGWSGNLMTPEYGAAVFLGSVLTSAELEPDPLPEANPCDRCKLCATVCPVEMVSKTESVAVTIAGREYSHGKKGNNARCLIGCMGYHGLAPDKKWSTWSPYRVAYPLPEDEAELVSLSRRLRAADPDMQGCRGALTEREKCVDPDEVYINTCANCALICWERRENREENRRLLVGAGVVALTAEGARIAVPAGAVREEDTGRGPRVAVV
ncbi:MAG: 4Fe-4S binding protein [Chloroflexota bacterium]